MVITLNAAEKKLAEYIANQRQTNARKHGVKNRKISNEDAHKTDLEGFASELAFCKLMNIYPDLEIDAFYTADRGTMFNGDCYHMGLGCIDVKSTKHKNGHLLATLDKAGYMPDTYALMIGEFPTYKFVGYASAEELLDEKNIKDLGYGNGYALKQGRLKMPPELQSNKQWLNEYAG